MALTGVVCRYRLLSKIELFKGFQQNPYVNSVFINNVQCVPVFRHCVKFSSTNIPQDHPGLDKTISGAIKQEKIQHRSSSSSSSSSDSEFEEFGWLASKLSPVDYWTNPTQTTDVTVEYVRGLPQITVPLPSRRERCKFTLKPITNTVGDFLQMLKNEDKGIDRVVALGVDGTRIGAANTIENLLEENFQLVVNDNCYLVCTPKQLRITGEEAKRLSDIKALVNQLYEAMNVQEHNVQKEKDLNTKLETLRQELLPLEEQKTHLEMIAHRKSDWMAWLGLGMMSVQFGILARLTWWEYSWDIMEPVTYFVTYGTAMAGYAYFVLTKQEYVLNDVKDRQQLLVIHKKAKKAGLDLNQYNTLKNQIRQLEMDLYRIRDPLKLHTPPPKPFDATKSTTDLAKLTQ